MYIVTYEQYGKKQSETFHDKWEIYHLIWDNKYTSAPVVIAGIWEVE